MNKKSLICACLSLTIMGTASAQKKQATPKAKLNQPTVALKSPIDSFSYAIGVNIANSLKNENLTQLNLPAIFKGFEDVLVTNKSVMSAEQAQSIIQQKLQEYAENKKRDSKKKTDEFLAENKKRAGVTSLPNGLQYEVLQSGDPSGISPAKEDTVVVDYVGTLIDGKEFDNSIKRGQPATFPLNGVIKGWTEILQLMHVGDKWKVYIPSELGYGERGAGGSIPGNAALIFEINLREIKKATAK
jgi:FKBP-type peptidyl-prolyl cis-trans isomerase FklB